MLLRHTLTVFFIITSTMCDTKIPERRRDMIEIAHSSRRNLTRLAVLSTASNNDSSPTYLVVGYEEAQNREPATPLPKFRPDPVPDDQPEAKYPQLIRRNSTTKPPSIDIPKKTGPPLPPIPNRPIIDKIAKPSIFEKNKFEIINEYLEERISNLTVQIHNSNYNCDTTVSNNIELMKIKRKNEELLYRNKILEAENVLLEKMANNNGSYVKIVSNQPLKPVHCFEIENKYRMCEANKNTLESNINSLLNMNKNFPNSNIESNNSYYNNNCTEQTQELRKCLNSVEQCFEESENMVKVLRECEVIANQNLNQLSDVEKDVLRLNLDNKYIRQQVVEVNDNYLKLKNITSHFYNKLFDYAINIQEEGKYNESLSILTIILDARESLLGPDDPEVITIEHEIAFVLNNHKIAKYKDAHILFNKVLEKRRRIFGEGHPDTLLTLYNIADVMRNLKRNAYFYQEYLDSIESSQFNNYRDIDESLSSS